MAEKEIKVDLVAETSDIDRGMDKAAESINKLGKAANSAGRDFDASANRIQQSAKRARDSIGGMVSAMNGLAAAATVGAIGSVASGIVSMGVSAIKASAQMKQYEIAFSTMLGSAEKGKKMLADLQKFAAETPFDVQGVTKAAQQLLAFGFNAKEIIPTLRTLGDTAAGLGKSAEGVQQIAYALGQIKTSGTLKTQDMNQLTTAGIGAWEMLAEAAGKSITEIKEMTEKGMIDSATAIEVITQGMNDSFGGMMAKTAEEITGLWSNVTETAETAQATIGTYLADSLDVKGVLKTVAKEIGEVTDALAKAQGAGKSFREALQEAVPAPLIAAVGALSAVIGTALVASAVAATTAMAGLIGMSLPVIGAVMAIGAAISLVALYWDDIAEAGAAAMAAVEQVVQEGFAAFASIATRAMEAALSDVLWFADKGASGIEWMFNTIMGYCPEWVTSIRNAFDEALQAIHAWADNAIAAIAEVLSAKKQVEASAGGASAETAPTPEKKATKRTGPVDLTGGRAPRRSGGGGTSSAKKNEEADMKRREQELNRVTEALAKAKNATTDLQNSFADMQANIDLAGMSGSEAVYASIKKEKEERLRAIDEVLAKQKNAIAEAEKMRQSAEATGNAEALASAQALIDEREALNKKSELEAKEMRAQIAQQAYDESIRLETALNAAKADMNEALNAATHEQFLEYLESEKIAKLTALEEEMAYRQQLMDWRMESEQSLLEFGMMAGETLKNQMASGIADLITEGGKLSEVFKNITKSIVNMFVQWMVKRQLSSVLAKTLGRKEAAEQAANEASVGKALVASAVNKSIAMYGPVKGPVLYGTGLSAGIGLGMASYMMPDMKATGGRAKGWTIVGEEGPELVNFSRPGMVYTADETAMAMRGINPDLVSMGSDYTPTSARVSPSGAAGTISIVANQNIYGGINSGMDEEDAFRFFSDAIMEGVRGA